MLPPGARSGIRPGELLRVRVPPVGSGRSPGANVPTEEEVLQIAMRQAETPDVIRKCLTAQGVLAGGRKFGSRKFQVRGPQS